MSATKTTRRNQATENPFAKIKKMDNGMLDFGIQLAVVDNGFVYLGHVIKDGEYYAITRCSNVRKAGTTRGFGELAFEGPRPDTTLDPCTTVLVPEGRLCHFIECADIWNDKI